MKKMKIWVNGRFVDTENANVSVFDRGFLYGDGLFETMRSYTGVVFKLDEHMKRLSVSAKILNIHMSYSKRDIKAAIYRSLAVNKLKSAYIRLTVTRDNIIIMVKEFESRPERMYRKGMSAKIVGVRQNESLPLTGIKSLNFLHYILARRCATDLGYDEAILKNIKGHIAEGATCNIFLVKDNSVITPSLDSGILPGITRSVVIAIAKKLRLNVEERFVSPKELFAADEVFFTNSLAEVIPVVKIDSKRIGKGSPGDMTKLLHISYQREVIKEVLG